MYICPGADLYEYNLYTSNTVNCTGGGIGRGFFTLRQLYSDAKAARAYWNVSTDGFDLIKYKQTTLYLQPHPSLAYIFHWETDYRRQDTYAWPWYHPSELLLRSQHVIVWPKTYNPYGKGVKIKLKPPAIFNDEWFFMRDMYDVGLFTYQVQVIDVTNAFMPGDRVTGCYQLKYSATTKPDGPQQGNISNYNPLRDKGFLNAIFVGAGPPQGFDQGISKNIPLYISTWGLAGEQNVWVWSPADWYTDNPQRYWFKLEVPALQLLIRSGPFVSKGLRTTASVFMKYKVKWWFGGPSATEDINPGADPKDIPPSNDAKASMHLTGLQIRDPATVGKGVLHNWELRRGLLTARALQRLTALSPETEIHGGQRECVPSHSEEEASEEDSPWEATSEEE